MQHRAGKVERVTHSQDAYGVGVEQRKVFTGKQRETWVLGRPRPPQGFKLAERCFDSG